MNRYMLYQGKLDPSDSGKWVKWVDADGELRRLQHIVDVLKGQIGMAYHMVENIEANTRLCDGKVEVWCFGEWVDVLKEAAKAEGDK